mmetsp:Transcript_13002/g.27672  ORF Transcript_13002/g.27672 Transcript_13002/m.27672 type:complete len:259 (+) Transcript_13002:121-897(+)
MQPSTAEKERPKETQYLTKVYGVLRKHKGFLTNYPGSGTLSNTEEEVRLRKQYASERAIFEKIAKNEVTAFACGLALSALVFTSVRYAPRYLAVKIGGKEKERALKEADEISRKSNTRWIQQTFAFLVESSFGAWAGWRGYNIISSQNVDSYELIGKIPLCAGRSVTSDTICSDWVAVVHNEIQPEFWQNLDAKDGEKKLNDQRKWKAIRDFADNCVKRKAYENSYRKERGLSSNVPIELPDDVPQDILLSLQNANKK